MSGAKKRIRMTNSSRSLYDACPRRYWYRYVEEIVPNKPKPETLAFGTAVHDYLECLYLEQALPMAQSPQVVAMMSQYYKYGPKFTDWEVVAVEHEFEVPITNPNTSGTSLTFILCGKIDLILRHRITGEYAIVDHKTASRVDGSYINRICHNAQLYTYCFALMKTEGWNVTTLFLNVLEKATIRRRLATPPEKLKYRQDGGLYASCRLEDESDDELFERLLEWHDNQDHYQLHEVTPDKKMLEETHQSLWSSCEHILKDKNSGFYRQVTTACDNWHRECEYAPLCLHGQQPQIGPDQEWINRRAHEELEPRLEEAF